MIKSAFRNPPQSHQEWLQLLQKQESLRNIEAQKWQKQLKNAIDHLRKVMIALSYISSNYTMLIEMNNIWNYFLGGRISKWTQTLYSKCIYK